MYNSANVIWTLVAAFLVYFMQAGFALCEACLLYTSDAADDA